ncbi:MAG: hypothetical protein ACRD2F_00070 [Terriglobales bacterium]
MRKAGKDAERWDGFKPCGYLLDIEQVHTLPVAVVNADGKGERRETAIGDAYRLFFPNGRVGEPSGLVQAVGVPHPIQKGLWCLRVTAPGRELVFSGPSLSIEVLRLLAKCLSADVAPLNAIWFHFDELRVEGDDYSDFFVVYRDRIAIEQISLPPCRSSEGFDPEFLKPLDDRYQRSGLTEARARYWYRRFYSETTTGRIAALRDDCPLHFYPEGEEVRRRLEPAAAPEEPARWECVMRDLIAFLAPIALLILVVVWPGRLTTTNILLLALWWLLGTNAFQWRSWATGGRR